MVCCCVPNCSSRSGKNKGINFHEFPSNQDEKEKWLQTISRKDFIPNDSSRSSVVCSLHFKEEDYVPGLKIRKLKRNSCPSVFLNYPIDKQPTLKTPKQPPSELQCIQQAKEFHAEKTNSLSSVPCDDKSNVILEIQCIQKTKESHEGNTSILPLVPCDDNSYVNKVIKQFKDGDSQTNLTSVALKRQLNRLRMKVYRQNISLIKQQEKLDSAAVLLRNYKNDSRYKAFQTVINSANDGDTNAAFLLEQVDNFSRKRPKWVDETIRECAVWQIISPEGYSHARKMNLLKLPCKTTLNKYTGPAAEEDVVTQSIEEQLLCEVEISDEAETVAPLVIDKITIKSEIV